VLGAWTWYAVARARAAGWLRRPEYLTALAFLPLYLAFLAATASRVQYDQLSTRFMSPFAAALVVAVVMPTLHALETRALPPLPSAALGAAVLAFFIGQLTGAAAAPWPVWRQIPRPFEVVSPELTAAIRDRLASLPRDRSLLASNHKGFLLAEDWPGGEVFLGNDLHFRPSLLTESALDELGCQGQRPVVLVLDRSRSWPEWETGPFVQRLLAGAPSSRLRPLLTDPQALVLLADFQPQRCHTVAGR
jgi:hypothetical protein